MDEDKGPDRGPLDGFFASSDQADGALDLAGKTVEQALAALDHLIEGRQTLPGSVAVKFDAAAPGGKDALFPPVGQHLLAAKREGRIKGLVPLGEPGEIGFLVTF